MRKRFRVLLLAAIVAAVVVPVGFALSLENEPTTVLHAAPAVVATTSGGAAMRVLIPTGSSAFAQRFAPLPDGARLVVVGTLLFGLAAMVRRAA